MPKPKNNNHIEQFELKVLGKTVEVTLDCAGERIISTVFSAVPVQVRAPLLKRDQLNGLTVAEARSRGIDQRQALDAFIKTRYEAVELEVLQIRKSIKRISSYMNSINLANQIKGSYSEFD